MIEEETANESKELHDVESAGPKEIVLMCKICGHEWPIEKLELTSLFTCPSCGIKKEYNQTVDLEALFTCPQCYKNKTTG